MIKESKNINVALLDELIYAIDTKITDQQIRKHLEKSKVKGINQDEVIYSLPKSNKEQIERVSLFIKRCKLASKLTAQKIARSLPREHKMSRTALNAYIYGTIQAPPTRDFLIALFKVMKVPNENLDMMLRLCGYRGILGGISISEDLILEVSGKKGKPLNRQSISSLAKRIYSMAELLVEEQYGNEKALEGVKSA